MLDRRRVVLRLALETTADLRTVERWLDDRPVSGVTAYALIKAATLLKLTDEVDAIRAARAQEPAA